MEMVLGGLALCVLLILVIIVSVSTRENESLLKNGYESIHIDNTLDDLIESPYYNKYKLTFDFIRHFGKEPKYRVDWLLKSLDMGHELECNGAYVTDSVRKNFPYFCETKYEFEALSKNYSALKGSVRGILNLGFIYIETNKQNNFLQEKKDYWRNRLLEMASEGNLEAQAGLCRALPLFTNEEVERYKEKYEGQLLRLAENGNPYAQLAVGQFIAKYRSEESFEWLKKAGEQGLSDAYFYLASAYNSILCLNNDLTIRQEELSERELQNINKKIAECYIKGAELDNGVMVAECQYYIASYYRYGSNGFEKNLSLAKYWYKKALKNGSEDAANAIKEMEKWG